MQQLQRTLANNRSDCRGRRGHLMLLLFVGRASTATLLHLLGRGQVTHEVARAGRHETTVQLDNVMGGLQYGHFVAGVAPLGWTAAQIDAVEAR